MKISHFKKLPNTISKVQIKNDLILYNKDIMQPVVLRNFTGSFFDYLSKRNIEILKRNKIFKTINLKFFKYKGKYKQKFQNIGFNVTNSCNMHCKYCLKQSEEDKNTEDSVQQKRSVIKILRLFNECSDIITIEVSGGEPFLYIERLYTFSELLKIEVYNHFRKQIKLKYKITTNGTIMSEKIITFLKSNDVCLGISIDCSKKSHDKNRVFINANPSYDNIIKNVELLFKNKIQINTLMITATADNIDTFNITELKTLLNNFRIPNITIQLNKDWSKTGYEFLARIKDFLKLCKNNNINYYLESQNVISNYVLYKQGKYQLFSAHCAFYNQYFFSVNYDGRIKKCPYINKYISKTRISFQKGKQCNQCFVEAFCPGKCQAIHKEDTDCKMRQILFLSLLKNELKIFSTIDKKKEQD